MKFNRFFGTTVNLVPSAHYTETYNGHTVVLGNTTSATFEFYFRARAQQFTRYSEINTNEPVNPSAVFHSLEKGCAIVIVREIPIAWLRALRSLHSQFSGIYWFIDDDIPAAGKDKTLPPAYRKRLSNWYKKARPWLTKLCDQVWVSTPYLADKYALPKEWILPPLQVVSKKREAPLRCFYHGSASHTQEWNFVYQVVKEVQARNDNIWFEFIGDHALYKKFQGIPRVNILHPMPWEDYLLLTSHRRMDIGLAPLQNSLFNAARSHTKFLDITRQKAVGIYSSRLSKANDIHVAGAGIVLPDTVSAWVKTIEELSCSRREEMYKKAEQLANQWQTESAHLILTDQS